MWSYMTGGLLLEVQILEMYIYVSTKMVLYDRWSLITVVLKHRFHCMCFLLNYNQTNDAAIPHWFSSHSNLHIVQWNTWKKQTSPLPRSHIATRKNILTLRDIIIVTVTDACCKDLPLFVPFNVVVACVVCTFLITSPYLAANTSQISSFRHIFSTTDVTGFTLCPTLFASFQKFMAFLTLVDSANFCLFNSFSHFLSCLIVGWYLVLVECIIIAATFTPGLPVWYSVF